MLVMPMGRKVIIERLAFSPDGRSLLAATEAGTFLWRAVADGARAVLLDGPGFISDAQFAGRWIVTGTRDLWKLDPSGGRPDSFALWGGDGLRLAVSPDGARLIVLQVVTIDGLTKTRFAMWPTGDLTADAKVWQFDAPGYNPYTPHFLTKDRFVRVGKGDRMPVGTRTTFEIATHDAATGARVDSATVVTGYPYETCVSVDVRWLAMRGTNHVDVYPVPPNDGCECALRSDGRRYFTSIAFHPGGRLLAATNNDNTVKLLDVETGAEARTFTWHLPGRMRSVCFSPDGTLAAAGSDKGQAVVWDVDV